MHTDEQINQIDSIHGIGSYDRALAAAMTGLYRPSVSSFTRLAQ
jgi:hypothetical protein